MNKKQDITKQLEKIAFQKTTAFCYHCYQKAPIGVCSTCGSDDLMRELEGVGVEWGVEWALEDILRESLEPVNQEEIFESMVEDCYPEETKVGWLNLDTVTLLKEQEFDWEYAKDDYIYHLTDDEELITFNGRDYYWTYEIENFIKENLKEEVAS